MSGLIEMTPITDEDELAEIDRIHDIVWNLIDQFAEEMELGEKYGVREIFLAYDKFTVDHLVMFSKGLSCFWKGIKKDLAENPNLTKEVQVWLKLQ